VNIPGGDGRCLSSTIGDEYDLLDLDIESLAGAFDGLNSVEWDELLQSGDGPPPPSTPIRWPGVRVLCYASRVDTPPSPDPLTGLHYDPCEAGAVVQVAAVDTPAAARAGARPPGEPQDAP